MVIGCLVSAFVLSVTVVIPKAADETGTITDGKIEYVPCDMTPYWKAAGKSAPVKENFIFAGWYTADAEGEVTALQETELKEGQLPENTYAKFVPSYVLSVKTQVETKAEVASTATDKPSETSMRLLTAVDSGAYQEIGFEILYGVSELKGTDTKPITKVYKSMKMTSDDKEKPVTAKDTFGEAAEYLAALDIKTIKQGSFASKIYVRPYWKTLDGTKVEGLSKNVRVEDKYTDNRYISVPINLLTDGADAVTVAAGQIVVSYDKGKFQVATDTEENAKIDTGRLLKEMNYRVDEQNGKIIFAGNAENVTDIIKADGLYANIRFIRKTGYEDATEADLKLEKKTVMFCDWSEQEKTVSAW